jgi:hypothetical protein
MKARYLLPLLIAMLLTVATAQESAPDRVEVFAGYSHTSYSVFQQYSGPWVAHSFNGWESSASIKLFSHVGAEADYARGYSSSVHETLRTFMIGPRVSADKDRLGVYGHALFGQLNFNAGGLTTPASTFAFVLGGGVDFWFSRHIGVRMVQFDYIHNNNPAAVLGFEHPAGEKGPGNAYRVATGIAFRFGR